MDLTIVAKVVPGPCALGTGGDLGVGADGGLIARTMKRIRAVFGSDARSVDALEQARGHGAQVRAGQDGNAAARESAVPEHGGADARRLPPRRALAWGAATGQVVVGDIPREPPSFQPREELLAELDRADQASVVHTVTGSQGVGKTQLAAAYARARLAQGWRLVAWVNAQDAESLLGGMAAVADAAGMSDRGVGESTGIDAGQLVRHQLELDGDRCLIVFDDASDPDLLRPFIPAGGSARVLITSNRQSVATLATNLGVDVFSPSEALAFLARRTGLVDDAGAATVAAELGHLPLALAQAAAMIAGQDLGYGRYSDQLQALSAEEYPTHGQGPPCPRGIAEAILLSLEAVQSGDQGAICAEVMEVMAVLSAAGVRRDLLLAAGQAGAHASGVHRAGVGADLVHRALERLAERSLLTFSLDGQTVVAHRLVMQVVRDKLARQGRLTAACRAAASVLDARARALKGARDRPAIRDIPEQVAALQSTMALPAHTVGEEPAELLLSLRFWALYYLNELGDGVAQAIAVGEQLAADFERALGPDHPDTLNARNSLAIAYEDAGRTAEAIALHEQTLAAFERVLGPDHPDTLASRNNLAIAYMKAGRTAEAIALHEQALATYEGVWGPHHPRILAWRVSLAKAYRAAGRTAEAVALHEQILEARERVLGPDHLSTLGSRNNLANAYRAAGRTAEAVALHEQTLEARERVLGPNHPSTLSSRNNLANTKRATAWVP